MADPATIVTAAGAALQGLSMLGGAVAGSEEAGVNREDAAYTGQALRDQNARLMQQPGPMPGYTQDVQGYGPAPGPGGQYAPLGPSGGAPSGLEFTDGPGQEEQMMGRAAELAQGIPPELLQNAAVFQQQMMMPPPMPGGGAPPMMGQPQPQQPPNIFGIPLMFDDGPVEPTKTRPRAQR